MRFVFSDFLKKKTVCKERNNEIGEESILTIQGNAGHQAGSTGF
ncbi:protein of unknown function [Chryseobacterium sp. JV274]|nr:protein of unknown function [Chryseobacterium sp. JV274]